MRVILDLKELCHIRNGLYRCQNVLKEQLVGEVGKAMKANIRQETEDEILYLDKLISYISHKIREEEPV